MRKMESMQRGNRGDGLLVMVGTVLAVGGSGDEGVVWVWRKRRRGRGRGRDRWLESRVAGCRGI